jgi:hypothetical protein
MSISIARPLIYSLLFGAGVGVALGSPATPVRAQQEQAGISRAPEVDAGFRLLYELKPAEARAQFAAWQKSHPQDPLAGC